MWSVEALQRELAAGKSSSRGLVEQALARIADPAGEGARAFMKVYADSARADADHADRLRKAGSPWPALNLGILLTRLDRLDEAEPLFRESAATDPRFAPAHYQLGLLLERKGRAGDAVAEMNQAAQLDPHYPEPHYALARLYRREGEAAKADGALERFLALKKEKGR